MLSQLGVDQTWVAGRQFSRGRGCRHCSNTGFQGRHGLFEWLPLSDALREEISSHKATFDLPDRARQSGLVTLRQAGLQALLDGTTTAQEVLQYT